MTYPQRVFTNTPPSYSGRPGLSVLDDKTDGAFTALLDTFGMTKENIMELTSGIVLSDENQYATEEGIPTKSLLGRLIELTTTAMSSKNDRPVRDLAKLFKVLGGRHGFRRDMKARGAAAEEAMLLTVLTSTSVKAEEIFNPSQLASEYKRTISGYSENLRQVIENMCY